MIRVEILQEILPEVLAQGIFDELQVLLEMFLTERHLEEFQEASGDVIGEPVAIQDRDNVVIVGREAWIGNLFQVVREGLPLVGQN